LVKVTFRSWEELVIHENIRFSLEDFIKLCSIGVQPGGLANSLQWAEGVVFRATLLPMTEDVVREMLAGKIHWSAVEWALMPKYQQAITIGDINARIPIVDVSATTTLCDVAKALKATAES
jgi:hypothetical protein